jgi:uncharacterized protein YbjQ (UPF0145 family)
MVTCFCGNCCQSLEFEESLAGSTVACPTCGRGTVLIIPHRSVVVTTGNEIAGRTIQSYLGVVRGIVVRSPTGKQKLHGGLNQFIGGNIESYAEVCESARKDAFARMVAQANQLDADGIIAMRYDATEFAPGVQEVLAYGTAVKLSASAESR